LQIFPATQYTSLKLTVTAVNLKSQKLDDGATQYHLPFLGVILTGPGSVWFETVVILTRPVQ